MEMTAPEEYPAHPTLGVRSTEVSARPTGSTIRLCTSSGKAMPVTSSASSPSQRKLALEYHTAVPALERSGVEVDSDTASAGV